MSKNFHIQLKENNNIEKKVIDKIKYLSYLTALFHDLGKNNNIFQKKIKEKNNTTKDTIRHEIISFIIINYIINTEDFYNLINLDLIKELKNVKNFILNIFDKQTFSEYDLLLYSILSHHNLLAINYLEELEEIENIIEEEFNKIMINLNNNNNIYIYKEFDNKFKAKIYDIIDEVKLLKDNKLTKEEFNFIREIVMLSDHFISNKNYEYNIKDNDLLANKKQKLEDHLIYVAEETSNTFDLLFENNIQEIKLDKNLFGKEKYKWQDKVFNKLKKLNIKPNLVFNLADTGSGKTIANIKIMNGLNSHKFNILYPLITLTIQTGNVLKNDLNLDKQTSLSIITSNFEENEDFNINNINNNAITYQFQRNEKYNLLFNSNIVVSTIDYLMRAIETKKSKYLLPLARLLNSDLIIDEIDNLDLKDQKSILKLVFLAGIFNKKIIFSSATLTKELIEILYKTYYKGYYIFLKTFNINYDLNILLVSNQLNSKLTNSKNFNKDLENFLNRKKEIIPKQTIKFNIFKYDIDNIINNIKILSKNNFVNINNKKISVGLIKFYSINDLFKKSKEIIEKLQNKGNYKFLYYHSKTFDNENIEKFLYSILNRKNDKYKKVLDKNFNENTTLIIFSTPIIDTGKDFDFDFGITEYINYSNIIQTAGRINRHRQKIVNKLNFSIFENIDKNNNNKLLLDKNYEIFKNFNIKYIYNNELYKNYKIIEEEKRIIKQNLNSAYYYINNNTLLSSYFEKIYKFRKKQNYKTIDLIINFENSNIKILKDYKEINISINKKYEECKYNNLIINNNIIDKTKDFYIKYNLYNNNENFKIFDFQII